MTSPAQPGIGDAYKLHHVMGHDRIAGDSVREHWVLVAETSSRSTVRALARKRQKTASLRKGLPL
jgi:hypothetical protein